MESVSCYCPEKLLLWKLLKIDGDVVEPVYRNVWINLLVSELNFSYTYVGHIFWPWSCIVCAVSPIFNSHHKWKISSLENLLYVLWILYQCPVFINTYSAPNLLNNSRKHVYWSFYAHLWIWDRPINFS